MSTTTSAQQNNIHNLAPVTPPIAAMVKCLLVRFMSIVWLIANALVLVQLFVLDFLFTSDGGAAQPDMQAGRFSVGMAIGLFAISIWFGTDLDRMGALAGIGRRGQLTITIIVESVSIVIGLLTALAWNLIAQLGSDAGSERLGVMPWDAGQLWAIALLLIVAATAGVLTGCLYRSLHWAVATFIGILIVWPIAIDAIFNAMVRDHDAFGFGGTITGVSSFLEWFFSNGHLIAPCGLLMIPIAVIMLLRSPIQRYR